MSEGAEADTNIDLGELNFEGEGGAQAEPIEHLVKVAEVNRYEDIADLTTQVYNGNILVIRQDEVVARMVRVAHLRAPEQQLDPSFPRAAEPQFEDAVREERDVVRDAAPRRIDVRIFFSSRRRHTRSDRDWSSDVCSSD